MTERWLQATVDCGQASVSGVEDTFNGLGALVTWAEGADGEEILEPAPGATPCGRRSGCLPCCPWQPTGDG